MRPTDGAPHPLAKIRQMRARGVVPWPAVVVPPAPFLPPSSRSLHDDDGEAAAAAGPLPSLRRHTFAPHPGPDLVINPDRSLPDAIRLETAAVRRGAAGSIVLVTGEEEEEDG